MSSDIPDTVHLRDIARSVIRGLPDMFTVQKGLFNLLLLRPESRASIGLMMQKQAQRYPDRPALVFEEQSWTYAELNAWANRCAAVFRKQGVGAGAAVGILMENRPEVLACVLGVLKLGGIAAMLNPNQRGDVLAHSIGLTKAKLLIVGEECRAALESTPYAPGGGQALPCLWDGPGTMPQHYQNLHAQCRGKPGSNPPETAQLKINTPCFYIFTSGTTGMPKASVMTHYRWLRGAAGLSQLTLRLKPEDVFYCCLPLYHNNALTVSWGAAMGTGASLVLARKFSASKFWDDIRRHEVTAFCYIGELCRYLLNRPPAKEDRKHRVRLIIGNGLRAEIWDEFVERFGIEQVYEFYGASESNVAFINGFGLRKTAGFCPLSFAVVDFDAESERPVRSGKHEYMTKVGKGSVGLLITEVTDSAPFDGYTDRQASEAKLLRDVFKKGDSWVNTGDLVRDQGLRHIQFVDRIGDTFRWKGENVATTEVEAALNRFPAVTQAVVYGVQVPGADGRAGMAALSSDAAFDGAALARHLQETLPAYAVPVFIRLRAEQELTGTFKFRKVDLKKRGFDPAQIAEPLYVLLDRSRGYEPLTPEIYARIGKGELRL